MSLNLSLLLLAAASLPQAQDASTADSTATATGLQEFVVTGTRTPKLLKDSPVQTTVITSRDIARSDATDIRGLLQSQLPGVEFSYAMNQQVHMNFSGFGGQSVLFLIDGERLAGETMDDVDFSRLDMNNVARIEIVKGASSALYGSNAGGGVINIITKNSVRKLSGELSAHVGRHAEQRYTATITAGNAKIRNTLSGSFSNIDNYDVTNAPDPATRVITTVFGQRVWNARDRISYNPTDNLELSARGGFFFRQLARTADTPERYRDYSAGARARWRPSDNANFELQYTFDQYDKSDLYRITGLDVRSYSNVQNSVRAVYNQSFSSGTLTAGADFMRDYLMNARLADRVHTQESFDAFAQFDWQIDPRWEAVGAMRYDYFSDGSLSRVTPKLTVRYKPRHDMNLRLAWGMGFRAPTLKEKYYDFDMAGIWTVKGNPALKPETGHNINISADWTSGSYNATVSAYYNDVSDRITTGVPYYPAGDDRQLCLDYINLHRYRSWGADITFQAAWQCGVTARIAYSFTREHAGASNAENCSQYMPARPHSLTAHADWGHEFSARYYLSAGIDGRFLSAVSNREYRDYYNIALGTTDVKYPAYTIWKLSASQTFFDCLRLSLALDNILNYRPRYYYLNAPLTDGINFQATLSYKF